MQFDHRSQELKLWVAANQAHGGGRPLDRAPSGRPAKSLAKGKTPGSASADSPPLAASSSSSSSRQAEEFRGARGGLGDCKQLSGGERSWVTLCLLTALGGCLECPFRVRTLGWVNDDNRLPFLLACLPAFLPSSACFLPACLCLLVRLFHSLIFPLDFFSPSGFPRTVKGGGSEC